MLRQPDGPMNREIDTETDTHTGRQSSRQTERHANSETDIHTEDRQADRQASKQTERKTYKQTDRHTETARERYTGRQINIYNTIPVFIFHYMIPQCKSIKILTNLLSSSCTKIVSFLNKIRLSTFLQCRLSSHSRVFHCNRHRCPYPNLYKYYGFHQSSSNSHPFLKGLVAMKL